MIPTIDGIDHKTLSYSIGGSNGFGIFTWSLFYIPSSIPDRVLKMQKTHIDPYPSAVIIYVYTKYRYYIMI